MQEIPFPKMCGLCFLPFHVFLVNCSNYYVDPGKGGILYIWTQAHLFVYASGGHHIRTCETAARAINTIYTIESVRRPIEDE